MTNQEKRILAAYENAIASRGKRKGMLKSKCPPMGTDGAAMWQACMLIANPYKVGIGHMVLMSDDQRAFYEQCQQWADQRANVLRRLDHDRVALERWGVW